MPPLSDSLLGDSAIVPTSPSATSPAPVPAATPAPTPAAPQYSAQPAPTPADAEKSRVIRDALKARGLAVDQFDDDDAVLSSISEIASRGQHLAENEQLLHHGRRYLQHASEFEKWQAEQQKQAAAAPAEPAKPKWAGPKWDAEWDAHVKPDPETGRFIPSGPYASPVAVDEANKYVVRRKEFARRLESDPVGLVREAGLDDYLAEKMAEVEKRAYERITGEFRQNAERTTAERFVAENEKLLFAHDAEGRALIDRQTGQPALSPVGLKFREYATEAREMGVPNEAGWRAYAARQIQRDQAAGVFGAPAGQPAPAVPAAPPESPAETNERLLRNSVRTAARANPPVSGRGAHAAQRSGGLAMEAADDEFAAAPHESFYQTALRVGRQQGLPDLPPN